jgi:hypothetical protein
LVLEGVRPKRHPATANAPAYQSPAGNYPIAPTVSPPGTGPHADAPLIPLGMQQAAAYRPRSGSPGPTVTPANGGYGRVALPMVRDESEKLTSGQQPTPTQTTPGTQHTRRLQGFSTPRKTASGLEATKRSPGMPGCVPC